MGLFPSACFGAESGHDVCPYGRGKSVSLLPLAAAAFLYAGSALGSVLADGNRVGRAVAGTHIGSIGSDLLRLYSAMPGFVIPSDRPWLGSTADFTAHLYPILPTTFGERHLLTRLGE